MELLQLNLRAYGPFTNKTLDFGDTACGEKARIGLHILLGANEAGKSTVLRGLRAVLFGMNDMRDAHLHPRDMLRVAVKIRTAEGELLHVERRKGKGAKSLLFVGTEKPVPVEEWSRVLPVDDADIFEQMFGLNYERLLAGGCQLAEFKNDIGHALLAAAGDIGETVARMREMREKAEAIYNPRATSSKLRQAFSAYQAADRTFRDERYTSREYRAALLRREEIEEELLNIDTERARTRAEQHRFARVQTAGPHVHRLLEDEKALEAYGDALVLAEDFEQRYNATITSLRTGEGRRDDSVIELERLAQEMSAIPRDPVLAGLVAQIDQLKDLSGKILGARVDRPKREAEWKSLSSTRDRLCKDLGVTVDTVPRLHVEQRRRIESLAGKFIVLEAKRNESPGRIAGLESSLREAKLALADIPAAPDTTELAEFLVQVRAKKQPEDELKRLRIEQGQFVARLNRDLGGLHMWNGTPEQLEAMRAPLTASVNTFAERFVKHEARGKQLLETRRSILGEIERQSASLKRLERERSIPTEAGLSEARERRENGWAVVKDNWLRGIVGGAPESGFLGQSESSLSEAYESAVSNADAMADSLRFEAERVEQKRATLEALDASRKLLRDCELAIGEHSDELLRLEAEWNILWSDAAIAPRSPREMQAWLEVRATLIGQWRDLCRLSSQVDEAEGEVKRWRESLAALLGTAAVSPLADLVNQAEKLVRESVEIRRKRCDGEIALRQLRLNLEAAHDERHKNESNIQEWRASWVDAIAGVPVSEQAEPAAVQELVRMIDAVHSASENMDGLRHRIGTMEADETSYIKGVRDLATRSGRSELLRIDALLAINTLQEMARDSQTNETRAKGIVESQAREQQKLADALSAISRCEKILEELRLEARTETLATIPDAIRASQKRIELVGRIDGHKGALANSCANLSVDEFVAQVRAANLDLLPATLEEVRERLDSLEDRRTRLTSEKDGIDREFKVREAAVALRAAVYEKESAAARIDALANEYIEQHLGVTLLAKAMALYREKHQDPLLKRAGEYFATLTCGAFVDLVIDEDENRRVLKGVRSQGAAHLEVDAMSDGTRDQLFLALRLAYIENYCETAVCPVILDDVLMAFDDDRTVATFRALQELSRKTQVLVFTHQKHHVALANRTLGEMGYRLHELDNSTSSAVVR
jgi:uncharacterized protein YhaN